MIVTALLLQAAAPVPQAIGRQALPARGCAAYLWSRGPTPALVAMVSADPATLRMALGPKAQDYPRTAQTGGDAGFGFAATTEYRAGEVTARVELVLAPRSDLSGGAVVTDATLTLERPGADTAVLPVGGLVGCAPAQTQAK
jgi:hypothetical protein